MNFIKPFLLMLLVSATSVTMMSQNKTGVDINWHKMKNDSIIGVNSDGAWQWLESHHLLPKQQVVIGYIDTGADSTNVDIIPALWTNSKELKDGKDNDRNGYIDDVHGWNFLGSADGKLELSSVGTEEYREFKRLYPKYKNITDESSWANNPEFSYYIEMKRKAHIDKYLKFARILELQKRAFDVIKEEVAKAYPHKKNVTVLDLMEIDSDNPEYIKACQIVASYILKVKKETSLQTVFHSFDAKYNTTQARIASISNDKDKRLLLGDNMKNHKDRYYGNPNFMPADEAYDHAMFGMGLIAAQGHRVKELKGIFPQARLMPLRAVPEQGDEYDKDIASAIYYAVNNGAKVINLSLGKTCSPDYKMVAKAMKYARKHDVLIVAASGNSSYNVDSIAVYPQGLNKRGDRIDNLIRVGASDRKGEPAFFSNYGKNMVDVFAPGREVCSFSEDGESFRWENGTSFAAPIVSAVAAMIRAYYPQLTAAQVKNILIKSVTPINRKVKLPGDNLKKVPFKDLCVSGGIVNAKAALEAAQQMVK